MRIVVKHPADLDAAEIAAWRALLQGEALQSPYFAPDFIMLAGDVHARCGVALAWDGERLAGVLPFQRGPLGFCRPVGGALSDFHGLIAAPDARLDIRAIAAAAGARVFGFDHLPADQARHGFPGEADGACAVIGLDGGYDAWREGRAAETGAFKTLDRKRRKLEREAGAVRVVMDETGAEAFEQLIAWKREQMRAAGHFDIFAARAPRALVEAIRARRNPSFRGLLSALYVDDRLAAAHFGMQAGPVLHYWFPGYDAALSRYSPGNILLDELARAGAEMGWRRIHLGREDYRYKREFASDHIPLMTGVLRTPSMAGAAHRAAAAAARAFEAAPLGPVSHWPGKAMRKASRIADFGWAAA